MTTATLPLVAKQFVDAKGNTWHISGFAETSPSILGPHTYFPSLASKYHASASSSQRVISICIPCYNEEGADLQRTIDSLRGQHLPLGTSLEIVVVMDGIEKMSPSMKSYVDEIFGVLGHNNGNNDPESGVHQDDQDATSLFASNVETIIVEPNSNESETSTVATSLSLILKKNNHRKVNSQMWWLGGHAIACKSEFLFATDCGIYFDPSCMQQLMDRLDKDERVAAVTGFQRVMTAAIQGDDPNEIFTDPLGYALRQIQSFDFESDHVITKSSFDSVGFLPVIPGPCGLYRSSELGTLKQGVARQYFSLINQDATDLVFGNVQLAEDRIPSCLLVFRQDDNIASLSNEEEDAWTDENRNKTHLQKKYTRTGFVPDATFYYEAEKPLGQLVKQRRRWINGSYAAYLWVVRQGWLWKGNQPFLIKLFAFIFIMINLIQGAFVRVAGPATMAILTFNSIIAIPALVSDSTDDLASFLAADTHETNFGNWNGIVAVLFTAVYLVFYAVFMVAHTPRAVPVKDKSGNPTDKWRNDRKSAYHPVLFGISFVISALQVALLLIVAATIFIRMGWRSTPSAFRLIAFVFPAPYLLAIFDGIVNSRRPNLTSFLNMVRATPVFILSSFWFFVWLPAYSSARVADLSWGK